MTSIYERNNLEKKTNNNIIADNTNAIFTVLVPRFTTGQLRTAVSPAMNE